MTICYVTFQTATSEICSVTCRTLPLSRPVVAKATRRRGRCAFRYNAEQSVQYGSVVLRAHEATAGCNVYNLAHVDFLQLRMRENT